MSGDCNLWGWINVVVSSVTSALCVFLLVVFYIKLSRKIDNHTCSNQASSSTCPKPEQPNVSLAGTEVLQKPSIRGVSESSSDSSDSSDSSPSTNQCPLSDQGIDYTTLIFQGPGCSTGASGDYENMKMGADYVNVDPQKRKVDFWTCSSPVDSKPAEYTEVKL